MLKFMYYKNQIVFRYFRIRIVGKRIYVVDSLLVMPFFWQGRLTAAWMFFL